MSNPSFWYSLPAEYSLTLINSSIPSALRFSLCDGVGRLVRFGFLTWLLDSLKQSGNRALLAGG